MLTRLTLCLSFLASPALASSCLDAVLTGPHDPHPLLLEVADTDLERGRGLMFRESMEDTQGMLFIFDSIETWPFWMANTYIDLDIVHLDQDGTILEVLNGKAFSHDHLLPSVQTNRVLEVNAGLIKKLEATQLTILNETACQKE